VTTAAPVARFQRKTPVDDAGRGFAVSDEQVPGLLNGVVIVKRSPPLQNEAMPSIFAAVIGQLTGIADENTRLMLHTRDGVIQRQNVLIF